jgi:wyosine [tRNA(Phe)-imidazoG37] synthetase (radical SAM superfamily)
MKYLFGPVNSRRLGLSQGVDLLPSGICNFNCIYCEINRPKKLSLERKEYFPTGEIIDEIHSLFSDKKKAAALDVFTITASGEPTLHSGIGAIIQTIKERTAKPVTVLTNGGLLHVKEVRQDLADADIVIPSLDSARVQSFQKINRPAPGAALEKIIQGIAEFGRKFKGKLWLEILIAEGVNDSPEDICELKKAIAKIKPDKIQLNTVVRPPFESFARPVSEAGLNDIAEKLEGEIEIIARFTKKDGESLQNVGQSDIIELLQRRPATEKDICESLRAEEAEVQQHLAQLAKAQIIVAAKHTSRIYWTIKTKE